MENKNPFIEALYATCLSADIPIVSADTAAKILAVVYVHGNNEFMVYCPKFIVDIKYIQSRFQIDGGEVPDPKLICLLQNYIKDLEAYEKEHPKQRYSEWAVKLFKDRYGVDLIN